MYKSGHGLVDVVPSRPADSVRGLRDAAVGPATVRRRVFRAGRRAVASRADALRARLRISAGIGAASYPEHAVYTADASAVPQAAAPADVLVSLGAAGTVSLDRRVADLVDELGALWAA